MVQLFVSEEYYSGPSEYCAILESLYYDLTSDPRINSLLAIKTRLNYWPFAWFKVEATLPCLEETL